jgi:ankyrin repeat protein
MSDWKFQQMIKASGWPLAPDCLAAEADFTARLDAGLVPLHWACREAKAGVLRHMIEHGANLHDRTESGQGMLDLALASGHFQTVMLVIERLKSTGAPTPDAALRERLIKTFSQGHTDAKNRLQQALRDWDRLARSAVNPAVPPR